MWADSIRLWEDGEGEENRTPCVHIYEHDEQLKTIAQGRGYQRDAGGQLARAVVHEVVRRAAALGVEKVVVGAALEFYLAIGFEKMHANHVWVREFCPGGPMSRLYFARHGESEANILKVISNRGSRHGLTEKGRRQAAELASNLKGAGATRLYSSPLLRALQTAEILSSTLGVDYDVTDALREFDCGIVEGRSDPESWDLHRQVVEDWLQHGEVDARIDQGESFSDIQNRFVPFIESLLEAQSEADVSILVGHGGLYLCMLPLILVNVSRTAALPFPNAAYVLAEARSDGLVCLEWCGRPGVHIQ